ncbi:hypothetical protein WMY93_003760 [Mugilogobius chulae]|uniref:Mitochondrial 2-oxodicarboxylate carrier n=1 Tax=Mugilogobius chulae TaxID=88201 RepID=A0AAW0Q0C1_9GOBI
MQLDFESVEEAVMIFKQSAEEKMKHLSQKLNVKESQSQQLQEQNESLQKEVQKAEVIVEKEVEQEEVEGLKNAQSVSVSETEQETTTSTEQKEQKTNQPGQIQTLKPEKKKRQTTSQTLQSKKMKKGQEEVNSPPETKNKKKKQQQSEDELDEIDLTIRALDQQIRQAEEARLGASCLEKNKKNQEEEVQRKEDEDISQPEEDQKQAPQTKTKPASPEPDHDGKCSPQHRDWRAKTLHLDQVTAADQPDWIFGFYKGILPPILAETPKRAVKFFCFEQYKKLLGLTPLSPGVQPSSFAQARKIIKAGGFGLNGLNRGLTSTLGRHGIFNMIYFGFYFNVKDAIPARPTLEFMRKFTIGLVSGTISSCVNIPWDVAKSRIQGPQPVPGEIKYKTCMQTMALVYKEEGPSPSAAAAPPPEPLCGAAEPEENHDMFAGEREATEAGIKLLTPVGYFKDSHTAEVLRCF